MNLRSMILSAFARRPMRLAPSDWTFVKFHFGQSGEDAVFMSLWDWKARKTGFYVDVGAYHPIDLSNTHALYRHGWRGLTIDPNPSVAPLFARHRPAGKHLTCGVAGQTGEAAYFSFRQRKFQTLNCMDAALAEERSREFGAYDQLTVPVRPLADIVSEHAPPNGRIDLLSVDCEGMDAEVLRSHDWQRFAPAYVMVEDNSPREDSETALLLGHLGYELLAWAHATKIYRGAGHL